jgi:endonuclease/exonuclease/phosphatase family metal-dependent hydrolase
MKFLRTILKITALIITAAVIAFTGMIVYAVITDYRPAEKITISESKSPQVLPDSSVITALSWNIGYCGLDRDMDFFYDGGEKVMTPKKRCLENLLEVMGFLKNNDSIDFILLQEVDVKSKRSYRMDQNKTISAHISNHKSFFAPNYDVFFVPLPPAQPMGKVFSGITTLSAYEPSSSVRYSFPGKYGFPKQLFMLDRCFMVNRHPLKSGKELIVINTHNEAFDPGNIRKAQMEYLRNFVLDEYKKGNYIVAGGDWNQCPPEFKPEFTSNKVNTAQMTLNSDYLPADWTWAYDNTIPSNRSVTAPYDPATTTTTVIDFFLLSPNVEKISVRCINLEFRNSDHNPVVLTARLK